MRGTMMLLVLTMLAGASSAAGAMDIESLTIVTKGGGAHLFQVEVARTNEERSQGLMFREKLEPDKGMLFEFRQPQLATMWMKNTVISLDMLFIRKNGEIARIAERTEPYSERTITSGAMVTGVLEIAGGRARELGIAPGDLVQHPFFGAQ